MIIDVSGEQHQKIKVLAALQGKTIRNYVLEKLFPESTTSEDQSWEELSDILAARIEEVEKNPPPRQTFEQLTLEIIQNRKSSQK